MLKLNLEVVNLDNIDERLQKLKICNFLSSKINKQMFKQVLTMNIDV